MGKVGGWFRGFWRQNFVRQHIASVKIITCYFWRVNSKSFKQRGIIEIICKAHNARRQWGSEAMAAYPRRSFHRPKQDIPPNICSFWTHWQVLLLKPELPRPRLGSCDACTNRLACHLFFSRILLVLPYHLALVARWSSIMTFGFKVSTLESTCESDSFIPFLMASNSMQKSQHPL